MNWLITGGCGFIGSNLARKFLCVGEYRVRIVDNLKTGKLESLSQFTKFETLSTSFGFPEWTKVPQFIPGDIRSEGLIANAADGADVIVHLAANTGVLPSLENPKLDLEINGTGTLNCLEAARARHVKKFVFASSGAALGDQPPPFFETLAGRPMSPYGASKLTGEAYCSAYWHSFGVETTSLRFSNVYGPGSGHKESVVAKFIGLALKNQPLPIRGDGSQTRDFIFVEDLCNALVKAANSSCKGEVFQIATGRETSVLELVNVIRTELKNQAGIEIDYSFTRTVQGDIPQNFALIKKAKELLDWEPKVDLQTGIQKTIAWFLSP
jgi:UDP-glucose 4-epimerase